MSRTGAVSEPELFALLERTEDAAFTVTEGGEIRSWNSAAERLFGYPAAEVLHRNIDEVLEGRDGSEARPSGMIPDYDVEVRTASGRRIWVNVSTIALADRRTGRRLLARLARDIDQLRRNEDLVDRMLDAARQLVSQAQDPAVHAVVEPLSDQERRILTLFAEGRSGAAIARHLRISAQTLRNHLHRINRKLRTHSRLEAVTHAQRRGLLQPRRGMPGSARKP